MCETIAENSLLEFYDGRELCNNVLINSDEDKSRFALVLL